HTYACLHVRTHAYARGSLYRSPRMNLSDTSEKFPEVQVQLWELRTTSQTQLVCVCVCMRTRELVGVCVRMRTRTYACLNVRTHAYARGSLYRSPRMNLSDTSEKFPEVQVQL